MKYEDLHALAAKEQSLRKMIRDITEFLHLSEAYKHSTLSLGFGRTDAMVCWDEYSSAGAAPQDLMAAICNGLSLERDRVELARERLLGSIEMHVAEKAP